MCLQHRLAFIYAAMTIHCELLFNIFIISLALVFCITAFLNCNFQFSVFNNYFFSINILLYVYLF